MGFVFGQRAALFLDASLLLIEPDSAAAYAAKLAEEKRADEEAARPQPSGYPVQDDATGGGGMAPGVEDLPVPDYILKDGTAAATRTVKHQFFCSIDLDPIQAKKQFADIVDEVVLHFTARPGIKVKIAIDIDAYAVAGFDESLQRVVRENCAVLHIKPEFEEGE